MLQTWVQIRRHVAMCLGRLDAALWEGSRRGSSNDCRDDGLCVFRSYSGRIEVAFTSCSLSSLGLFSGCIQDLFRCTDTAPSRMARRRTTASAGADTHCCVCQTTCGCSRNCLRLSGPRSSSRFGRRPHPRSIALADILVIIYQIWNNGYHMYALKRLRLAY